MWDLPRPGLEPVSPALAGRLSTTVPPGKPSPPSYKNHSQLPRSRENVPSALKPYGIQIAPNTIRYLNKPQMLHTYTTSNLSTFPLLIFHYQSQYSWALQANKSIGKNNLYSTFLSMSFYLLIDCFKSSRHRNVC